MTSPSFPFPKERDGRKESGVPSKVENATNGEGAPQLVFYQKIKWVQTTEHAGA